jgi:arabinogalactan endo-1,4-beta-galactosidase
MKNLSDKSCREIKTRVLVSISFSPPENRAVYEMMWKKNGKAGQSTDDDIIRRMRFACWVGNVTKTHSEY